MTLVRPLAVFTSLAALGALAPAASAQQSLARFDAAVVVTAPPTRFEAVLDLDGDGDSDVVDWLWTNTNGREVRVGGWINDGSGALANAWNAPLTFAENVVDEGQDSAVGDLDGDARDDFALSFGKHVYLFTSNGAALPSTLAQLDLPAAKLSIALGDFDGDGLDDLASSDGSVTIRLNARINAFQPAEPAWNTLGSSAADDLHAVDVDGSGADDILDVGDNTVWFYTIAGGLLAGTQGVEHGLGPSTFNQLTTGDVDADGDEDAVVFDMEHGRCAVLRQGAGGWVAEAVQDPAGPATNLADVNGDGALDGVCCSSGGGGTAYTSNNYASQFEVAVNDGHGAFSPAFVIPSIGGHHIAGAVDMDGDGDTDLVAGRSIYFATGSLDVTPLSPVSLQPLVQLPTHGFTASSLCDADADGDPDVVFGLSDVEVNAGDGTFELRPTGSPPVPGAKKWLGPGVQGDFDGDGDTDLLVTRWQGIFPGTYLDNYVIRNNGSGVLPEAVLAHAGGTNLSPGTIVVWDKPEASLVADADGDGDLDVFLFSAEAGGVSRLSLNDGTGFFTIAADFSERVQHVVRLNADALPDLVLVSNVLRVRFGAGGGAFGPAHTLSTVPNAIDRVAVQDVDGNGALDIVACQVEPGRIDVQLNDGQGAFTADTTMLAAWPMYPQNTSYPRRIVSVDVDGDGTLDLLAAPAASTQTSAWVLLKNRGAPGFTVVQQALVPGGVADFDGDGDADVLTQQLNASIGPSFVARNAAFSGDEVGLRRQYGSGNPGTGGVVPVLGATGPFRTGASAAIRITGLPPSRLGIVTVGFAQSALVDVPWKGSTGYNWPWVLFFTVTSSAGQPGVDGSARVVLPFVVPPELAGIGNLYHQVWWADAGAYGHRSSSNGLLVDYD